MPLPDGDADREPGLWPPGLASALLACSAFSRCSRSALRTAKSLVLCDTSFRMRLLSLSRNACTLSVSCFSSCLICLLFSSSC